MTMAARLEERVIKSQGIKDKNYATVVLRVIKIIIKSLPQNQGRQQVVLTQTATMLWMVGCAPTSAEARGKCRVIFRVRVICRLMCECEDFFLDLFH